MHLVSSSVGGAELDDLVLLAIVVPFMALVGLYFLGSAVLAIYRDVLGIDDKFSQWLDRAFGTWGLGRSEGHSGARKLVAVGVAAILGFLGYLCIRYGVIEPIAEYVSG